MSGAEKRRQESPDLYRKLLEGPHETELIEVIKIGQFYACSDIVILIFLNVKIAFHSKFQNLEFTYLKFHVTSIMQMGQISDLVLDLTKMIRIPLSWT